jgi:penicillin-binding protein 1A
MELARAAKRYSGSETRGVSPNSMPSRALPPDEPDDSEAGTPPPADPNPESDPLQALPASALVRALGGRVVVSARRMFDGISGAIPRWRSHFRTWRVPVALSSVRPRRGLVIALGLAAIPAVYVAYCIVAIPFAGSAAVQAGPSAIVFEGEDGTPLATRGIRKGEGIAADHIPPLLAKAVVAIEDRRFYNHGGIDMRAIMRAAWHDVAGHGLQGGSTITQQLARRLYLTPERSLKRKVQEAVLAEWLELRLSKNRILARYLNTAYFGDGAYGADSAALRYFGKNAQELSLSEAAMLAGLIKAPSELDPDRNLEPAQQRAAVVLDAMVESGAVTQQQADAAKAQPAVLRVAKDSPPGGNYFVDTAAADAKSQIPPTTEDLTVRTTLDPELQHIAETVVARRLAAAKGKDVGQAALVAMTPDGAIVAMVGGRDYNESQFNRATQARRQPGSLFKAFVYLTALRKGYTPDSVIVDRPVSVGDWEPENYGDRYFGPVTLRTAFAHSLNSVAVQLAQAVGIQNVIATAKELGIRSDLPVVPSVALGSGAVTPLEMTRAYAAIATNTTSFDSYAVRAINEGGRTAFARATPALSSADNPTIHAEMLDLLSSVVREGTGTAARLDRPVGGKTGTSEDYRDARFVGFTSDLVVGVWVGNDDNSPMNGVVGGSVPAAIWHDFVGAAETVRHAAPARTATVAAAMPTISFNTVAATDATMPDRGNGPGLRSPFRLFWFRF